MLYTTILLHQNQVATNIQYHHDPDPTPNPSFPPHQQSRTPVNPNSQGKQSRLCISKIPCSYPIPSASRILAMPSCVSATVKALLRLSMWFFWMRELQSMMSGRWAWMSALKPSPSLHDPAPGPGGTNEVHTRIKL